MEYLCLAILNVSRVNLAAVQCCGLAALQFETSLSRFQQCIKVQNPLKAARSNEKDHTHSEDMIHNQRTYCYRSHKDSMNECSAKPVEKG